MVTKGDKWVRIFDVPETSKHKKGFTIYKVISMLYPESCPDAITKITVWKRYNDFKKLHRDVKALHKSLKLRDKMPSLPNSPFFRRFDEEIVQERRVGILNFLEYTAGQPQLFTSNVFVKFFQTSHTPMEMLQSNISEIRAELSLPTETEYYSFHSPSSDDERTISDTDSVSTLSSITASLHTVDLLADPLYKSSSSLTRLSKRPPPDSHDSLSISGSISVDSVLNLEKNIFPTPPATPNCLNPVNPSQYILDASKHITLATQFETEKKYEHAFAEYKMGIDILLQNVKDDRNLDRKEMVRFKTEKYLLRAEKIYNLHLSNEMKNIQQYTATEQTKMEYKPLSDLYKYKVVKVISSGMLVLHSEFQKLYYVKVIQKMTSFTNDHLILPEHVPYMVKLHNFYNCENALFLVLQYCSGTKLIDYIKQRSITSNNFDTNEVFPSNRLSLPSNTKKDSDNDSDCSYTDLINDYAYNKTNSKSSDTESKNDARTHSDEHLNDYEIVSLEEEPVEEDLTKFDDLGTDELLEKSQKLLSSIDLTLQKKTEEKMARKYRKMVEKITVEDVDEARKKTNRRKSSDRSICDDFAQFEETSLVPMEDIVKWAAQIILALEKLHILGVVCCDLYMNKLLIDADRDVVITYVCATTERVNVHSFKNNLCLAPELYSFGRISNAADWWSLGIILYELLVGIPFDAIHPEILTNHTSIKIPKCIYAEGRSLLKQLLCFNPVDRLGSGINGTEDLKSHPFFSSISWDALVSKYLL